MAEASRHSQDCSGLIRWVGAEAVATPVLVLLLMQAPYNENSTHLTLPLL
jgi:hypothetical protein